MEDALPQWCTIPRWMWTSHKAGLWPVTYTEKETGTGPRGKSPRFHDCTIQNVHTAQKRGQIPVPKWLLYLFSGQGPVPGQEIRVREWAIKLTRSSHRFVHIVSGWSGRIVRRRRLIGWRLRGHKYIVTYMTRIGWRISLLKHTNAKLNLHTWTRNLQARSGYRNWGSFFSWCKEIFDCKL